MLYGVKTPTGRIVVGLVAEQPEAAISATVAGWNRYNEIQGDGQPLTWEILQELGFTVVPVRVEVEVHGLCRVPVAVEIQAGDPTGANGQVVA